MGRLDNHPAEVVLRDEDCPRATQKSVCHGAMLPVYVTLYTAFHASQCGHNALSHTSDIFSSTLFSVVSHVTIVFVNLAIMGSTHIVHSHER